MIVVANEALGHACVAAAAFADSDSRSAFEASLAGRDTRVRCCSRKGKALKLILGVAVAEVIGARCYASVDVGDTPLAGFFEAQSP